MVKTYTGTYTAEDCHQIGSNFARKNEQAKLLSSRAFIAFYNRTPEEVCELWEICSPRIKRAKIDHLFWALMYMKLYPPADVITTYLDVSFPTLDRWVWVWIEAIAMLHDEVIIWSKRNRNVCDRDIWCRVSVDGTDFQIGEPVPFNKKWKSPKQKGASVKYEVAISIYSGDIVWIHGPHVGSKHDYTIFKEKLKQMLDEDEMIEADAGYGIKGVSYDDVIRSRDDYLTEEERLEKSEIRARHETCNRRFKTWSILKQQFRNCRKKHQLVFFAVVVMTQLSIDNGNVLFGVEPEHITKQLDYNF